ncbi:SpoIIIAH-like family protein [Fictibacillus iocasae]|uniref:SpoIIIAH-like family protein n=1 Tax=Fictibacillus iocasae TaxID=2715437 RepID=A0ABW2NLH2_9BACL
MLLKKQTVWLLTMLSLIIVLSVYYITAPGGTDSTAFLESGKKESKKNAAVSKQEDGDMFTMLRLQRDEHRDEMEEDYTAVVASPSASAEVQAEAWAKISELQALGMKEATLETLIKAMGFHDALVNTMESEVRVIVKSEKNLSKKQVVSIMGKAREHLGKDKTVAVEYQSATAKK